MAFRTQVIVLFAVGIYILTIGLILTFVALPLFASGEQCTIIVFPRPLEECIQIMSFIGYGLLALGGLLLVGGFLMRLRR